MAELLSEMVYVVESSIVCITICHRSRTSERWSKMQIWVKLHMKQSNDLSQYANKFWLGILLPKIVRLLLSASDPFPHAYLFWDTIAADFICMNNNAKSHQLFLLRRRENITRMNWPAYFSDLNIIKYEWISLNRCFWIQLYLPENTQDLQQMCIEDWAILPVRTFGSSGLEYGQNVLSSLYS